MTEPFSKKKLDQLMEPLVALLAGAGMTQENVMAAIDQAYSKHTVLVPKDGPQQSLTSADKFLMSNLVSYWGQLADYCDDAGAPLPLSLSGAAPSLATLLAYSIEHTASVEHPPTIHEVEEWLLQRKVTSKDEQGRHTRLIDWFPSSPAKSAMFPMLLDYVGDLLHTARFNIDHGGGQGRFLRTAHVDDFPAAQLPKINRLTSEHGMDFLKTMDAFIMNESKDRSPDATDETKHIGVCVYLFVKDETSSSS